MAFRLLKLLPSLRRGRAAPSLAGVLAAASWAILGLALALLAADALMFYRYGFGEIVVPESALPTETFRVHEETIKKAAEAIAGRQAQYEAAPDLKGDLPNPFR